MKKNILITGQNKLLKKSLTDIFLNKGYHVITTHTEKQKTKTKALHIIPWNMRSPLSTKNVLLDAASQQGDLDEIIILFPWAQIIKPFHETSSAEIEWAVDIELKSNLFIIKESIAHLQKEKGGTLSLVYYIPGTEILPPLDALGSGGFTGLVKSLFTFYQNEKTSINSYVSSSTETEEYAEYIFKTIDERQKPVHGKYYKYSEKTVLSALGLSIKR